MEGGFKGLVLRSRTRLVQDGTNDKEAGLNYMGWDEMWDEGFWGLLKGWSGVQQEWVVIFIIAGNKVANFKSVVYVRGPIRFLIERMGTEIVRCTKGITVLRRRRRND